jgi:hypothetical protein
VTAALAIPAARHPVVIRPAPRREPPFDDELSVADPACTAFDRQLPFDRTAHPTVWVPRPGRVSMLPDPAAWGRRLVIGLIETAGGHRPAQQVAPLLSPSVHRGLCGDFERARSRGPGHWLQRACVRTVRASEPSDGVAELCATVEAGGRVRALALRLEEQHGRWRCTRLHLG